MDILNLHDICNKLISSQIKSRQSGLNELQRALNQEDLALRIKEEDASAGVLHALTRNYALEVANFRKSSSSQATALLRASLECFQTTLEKANTSMTRNTLKSITTHILESLPSSQQPEYPFVAANFFACLKTIASHPPHVEQLKKEKWKDIVQVCITGVEVGNWHVFGRDGSRREWSDLAESRKRLPMRKDVADLMFCFLSLCLFPGAPLHEEEGTFLTFLFNFLATYDTASDARTAAIIALNRVLKHVAVNKIDLAMEAAIAVVQLFPDIWDSRVSNFKENMLLSLAIVFPYLHKCVVDGGIMSSTYRRAAMLLDLLKKDSLSQDRKTTLQLDDLRFSKLSEQSVLWRYRPIHSFIAPWFSLLSSSPQAETTWLSLQIQSSLIQLLDTATDRIEFEPSIGENLRVKRRRISPNQHFQNLIDDIFIQKTSLGTIHHLQILAFYLNSFLPWCESVIPISILRDLEKLGEDSNPEIIGWWLVCILGTLGRHYEVTQVPSQESRQTWTRIWITSSKHAALPATCRPACALMEAILQRDVMDMSSILPHIRSVFEYVELRGPGAFNDKACDFWNILLLKLQQGGIAIKSYQENSLKRWIEFRWAASCFDDQQSWSQRLVSLPLSCFALFCDISSTVGDFDDLTEMDTGPRSLMRHTLSAMSSHLRLINFLLNDEIYEDTTSHPAGTNSPSGLSINSLTTLKPVLIEKCSDICAKLQTSQSRNSISAEDIAWYTSVSMLSLFLLGTTYADNVFQHLTEYVSTCSDAHIYIDACIRAISGILYPASESRYLIGAMRSANSIQKSNSFNRFVDLLMRLSKSLVQDNPSSDFDHGFRQTASHLALSSSQLEKVWATRDLSRFDSSLEAYRIRLLARLQCSIQGHNGLSTWFYEAIALPPSIFFLVAAEVSIPFDEISVSAVQFLQTFKTHIAITYEWGGNEMTMNAAMSIVLAFLQAAKHPHQEDHLYSAIVQLYKWIIKVVLNRELSSPKARLKAGRLLQEISSAGVTFNVEDGADLDSPFLQIMLLQDVDMEVRFWTALNTVDIFRGFQTRDRVYVYRQIVDRLETDELNSETFAMRAYTLMQLTLASDDIRRAAMVNLLELGKFESCRRRVRSCFEYLAERCYRSDPKKLYAENCSQFICSWIDFQEDIFQFPYYVFGFGDFNAWSRLDRSELISQLINADRWEDAANIYTNSTRFEDLLSICLPHIVGDFQLLNAGSSPASSSVLERCEAALGSENYRSILTSNLALTLSVLVQRLDDRTMFEGVFESSGYRMASTVLRSVDLPTLDENYPDPPQPAFSLAKVILAIESHSHLLKVSSQALWSPANIVFVLRRLLDRIGEASDSTVQKSYLRRMVCVLCLAGINMKEQYTLEMLLIGVTKFVEKLEICREAMCIIKYVFDTNLEKLKANPAFLRRLIPRLLSSLQNLKAEVSDSETQQFFDHSVQWVVETVRSMSHNRSDMTNTCSLVEAFVNLSPFRPMTVGSMIKEVILEDQLLWREPENLTFALEFLSRACDAGLESISDLEELARFFLENSLALQHSAKSMVWLGSAIGLVSKDVVVHRPEHRSALPTIFEPQSSAGENIRKSEFVLGIIKFSHSHPEIAELLETALRAMFAASAQKGIKSNSLQHISRCLLSPHISQSLPRFQSRIPLSETKMWTRADTSFSEWFKNFACALAEDFDTDVYPSLVDAIAASPSFRMTIFPFLLYQHQIQKPNSKNILHIFNTVFSLSGSLDLEYSRLIIHVLLFLRRRATKVSPPTSLPLIDGVNYFHAAKAAISCQMYKTALLFLELCLDSKGLRLDESTSHTVSDIYRNLQDPDLAHAITEGIDRSWHQLPNVYKLHHDLQGLSDLHRARLRGKAEMGFNISQEDEDYLAVSNFIRKDGFPLPVIQFTGDLSSQGSDVSISGVYGSAWRLGIWDLPSLVQSEDIDSIYYSVIHRLLRTETVQSTDNLLDLLDLSVIRAVDHLFKKQQIGDSTKIHVALRVFSELRALFRSQKTTRDIALSWGRQIVKHSKYGSFENLEPQASVYNVVARVVEKEETVRRLLGLSYEDAIDMTVDSSVVYCEMTRLCGSANDLLAALAKTGSLEDKFGSSEYKARVLPAIYMERAEILWRREESLEAVETLRTLIKSPFIAQLSFSAAPQGLILAKLASWTSQLRLLQSDKLIEEFFEPASQSLQKGSHPQGEVAGKIYFEYASFCAAQLEDQHTIADIKRMENLHRTKANEVQQYTETMKMAKERGDQFAFKRLYRDHERATKLQKMDKEELQRLHALQRTFLRKAVENFLKCFAASDEFDHHVPKFCAIWLKHAKQKGLHDIVFSNLPNVPSYKFLHLLHQLCSRLSDEKDDDFQQNLIVLLGRVLGEHPFHSSHQIFSAIFGSGEVLAASRASAASKLANRASRKYENSHSSNPNLFASLFDLYSAYSDLANLPLDKKSHAGAKLAFSAYPGLRLFHSKGIVGLHLPPPSLKLPISLDLDYSNVPYISKFDQSFKIAGGINQPKILDSSLSNGKQFRELVKGNDDLHQDAIMQQIFSEMDGVMQRYPETRRRKMRIRTYRVVPLKPKTGVIEWVLDTIPLLEFLDRTHVTVYTRDWKWSACRQKIDEAASADHTKRLQVYQEVCEHFHPVLRYFFLEHFRDPDEWFSRRIEYSRSVAASSMIGHVLGLGDRHCQNILLDKQSGEVIHIDLGVAFEQGKMLYVPETVPFRLTRDMIDGFGVSGCEGPFLRASTFALTVLRQEEDTILTFLDVLKYDPLYNWTISPLKIWTMQKEMQGETNRSSTKQPDNIPEMEADRAIQVVKHKLSSRLSVEADVRRLILEATDEGNLSRMYCGWAPFA